MVDMSNLTIKKLEEFKKRRDQEMLERTKKIHESSAGGYTIRTVDDSALYSNPYETGEAFKDKDVVINTGGIQNIPPASIYGVDSWTNDYAYLKKKAVVGVDKPESEDEELLTSEKPSGKSHSNPSNSRLLNLYEQYLATDDEVLLYRILVKSEAISRLGNCCTTDLEGMSRDEIHLYLKDRIPNEVRGISRFLGLHGITINGKDRKKIISMVDKLYNTSPRRIFSDSIVSSDHYTCVIEEFTRRGIKIDEELLKPIDFRSLLRLGQSIVVFYTGLYNELTAVSINKDNPISRRGNLSFLYEFLETIPVIESKILSETININGIEYSKAAFESIIESDLGSFLTNLRVESVLYNSTELIDLKPLEVPNEINFL